MVLIISNQHDESTTHVVEWLDHYGKEWIRINAEDVIALDFLGDDIRLTSGKASVLISEITSYWYRRGIFTLQWNYPVTDENLKRVQASERSKIVEYVYYLLSKKKNINDILNSDVNKLIVTDMARECGIRTPKDYLFSGKATFARLIKKDRKYISKPISGDSILAYGDFSVFNYTTLVSPNDVDEERFFPSLVQDYIEKKYELRIFYLHGDFQAIAIFSQEDEQTAVDFRNYNHARPNRTVPFALPAKVRSDLDGLMKKLKLNCGSIDMIVTDENDYIFLEVNPIGQFGMVSFPGNFKVEKKIAQYL